MKKVENLAYLKSDTFVVLDIETTGLSPDKGGRIIEIGAVKIDHKGNVLDSYQSFFYPQMKIPKKIVGITGITDEMVKDAPVIFHELPKLHKFLGNVPVVCHNLKFDWNRFLLPAFLEAGIRKSNPIIDSLKLARAIFPDEKQHKLGNLCEYCQVEPRVAHRAYDDACMTADCLIYMIGQIEEELKEFPDFHPESLPTEEVHEIDVRKASYWEGYGFHRVYINVNYDHCFLKVYYDQDFDYWRLNQELDDKMDFVSWKLIQKETEEWLGHSLKDWKGAKTK